jgi:hypothetical protein
MGLFFANVDESCMWLPATDGGLCHDICYAKTAPTRARRAKCSSAKTSSFLVIERQGQQEDCEVFTLLQAFRPTWPAD